MSFLTISAPKTHNLILNYFQNYRRTITVMRTRNYHKRLEDRNQTDTTPVREIEWFEELDKGCNVYIKGHKYPMRGLMYWDDFMAGYIWKKAVVLYLRFIEGIEEFGHKNIFKKIFLLWATKNQYPFYLQFMHHALWDNIYEQTNKYSQPIRELHRVFPPGREKERDIVCFFIESDYAYRYRYQDIVMELNKGAFKKNPTKETQRLINIMISREISEGTMRNKWRALNKLVPFIFLYLKVFKPKILKQVFQMVGDLNIDETKPSKEDLYWMNEASSYNFRGIKINARKTINKYAI